MLAWRETSLWGWADYFLEISRFIEVSQQQMDDANYQYTEYVIDRYQMILWNITTIKEHIKHNIIAVDRQIMSPILSALSHLLTSLIHLIVEWQRHQDEIEANVIRYQVPLHRSTNPGRPRFVVLQEQLEYLRSLHFSWVDISRMLGISRMTLYRRRVEYDMIAEPLQSVSDIQLTDIIQGLRREFPDIGCSMVTGRLRSLGFRASRERIRMAIRISDPLNTALRWHGTIHRRPYSVPGPNSLWHIGMFITNAIIIHPLVCNVLCFQMAIIN